MHAHSGDKAVACSSDPGMPQLTEVEIERENRLQEQRAKLQELIGSNPFVCQKKPKEKSPRKRPTTDTNLKESGLGVKRTDLRSEKRKVEVSERCKKYFDISLLGDTTKLTQKSQFILFKHLMIPCPKCKIIIHSRHKSHWKRCVRTSLSSFRKNPEESKKVR